MSSTLNLRHGQQFVYKLEILQVFKPQTRQERVEGVERIRLDEPILVELGWYSTAQAARNYGSARTGRRAWYNNIGKPTWESVKVNAQGEVIGSYEWPQGYKWERREIPQPIEPDQDYRVYKVPVSLDMGEAVLLPALKRLYDLD